MNERYAKILRDIQSGKGLSKADQDFFINYTQKVDTAALEKIKNKEGWTDEDVNTYIGEALKLSSTPENKEKLLELAEKSEKGQLAATITSALNTGLAAFDLTQSNKQIKASDRALRRLRRPSAPAPLTADPKLEQALAEAQQGTFDAYRRLAPAQQQILDSYLSDLDSARTASTGQAGTYGALSQVASTRRGRRGQELVPLLDDVRAREQARYDGLLGMKLGENQAIQNSQAQNYPYDLYQYNNELQMAGDLGATGRSNFRTALTNLGSQVPSAVSDQIVSRRFDNIREQALASGVSEDVADLAVEADRNLLYNDPYSPAYKRNRNRYFEAYGLPNTMVG